jgi:hypothetical protein
MAADTKKKPDTFGALLCAMQAAYEDEIHRLADLYRPRILAGEFSGSTPPGPVRGDPRDEPRYLALERDLEKTHPWITGGERTRLVVVACSRWLTAADKACMDPKSGEKVSLCWDGDFADAFAPECMAHDILAVAASRGWVKPMRFISAPELYALRVA